jgi:hypothetical protein
MPKNFKLDNITINGDSDINLEDLIKFQNIDDFEDNTPPPKRESTNN